MTDTPTHTETQAICERLDEASIDAYGPIPGADEALMREARALITRQREDLDKLREFHAEAVPLIESLEVKLAALEATK